MFGRILGLEGIGVLNRECSGFFYDMKSLDLRIEDFAGKTEIAYFVGHVSSNWRTSLTTQHIYILQAYAINNVNA